MANASTWVFGYGSLIWNPGFPFRRSETALLFGARVETACVTLFAQSRIIAIAALYLFIALGLHLRLVVTAWRRLVLCQRQAGGNEQGDMGALRPGARPDR